MSSIEDIKSTLSIAFQDTPVKKAILFGSYAKKTADNLSDIDLVIDSKGQLQGLKFFGLLDKLVISLGTKVDLIDLNEIEQNSDIYNTIINEGVVVYDRAD